MIKIPSARGDVGSETPAHAATRGPRELAKGNAATYLPLLKINNHASDSLSLF